MSSLLWTVALISGSEAWGAVGIKPAAGVSGGCVHTTIADALAIAIDGDTLMIAPDTYEENLGEIHASVTFQGSDDLCMLDAGGAVILDGNGAQIAFVTPEVGAPGPNTVAFRGVALTDGSDPVGGLLSIDGAHVDLHDAVLSFGSADAGGCVAVTNGTLHLSGTTTITECAATGSGGAILAIDSDVTMGEWAAVSDSAAQVGGGLSLTRGTLDIGDEARLSGNTGDLAGGAIDAAGTVITIDGDAVVGPDNASSAGGGIRVWALAGADASLVLSGNARVTDNRDVPSPYGTFGGGIYAHAGIDDVVVVELLGSNLIDHNEAGFGGGIALSGAELVMTEGTLVGLNSAGLGGGILAMFDSEIDASGGTLARNVSATDGGGLAVSDSVASLENVTFDRNTADGDGGGIAIDGMDAEVEMDSNPLTCDPATLPTNTWCGQLKGNTATRGGAVSVRNGGLFDVDRALMRGNTGSDAGSAVFGDTWSGVALANVLVHANTTFGANTAAIEGNDALFLDHATVADNTGSAGIRYGAGSGGFVNRTISFGNTGAGLVRAGGAPVGGCNDFTVVGAGVGLGHLTVNPLFVSPGTGDFHLQAASPVLGLCALSNNAIDLDHHLRAGNVDMGALEHF